MLLIFMRSDILNKGILDSYLLKKNIEYLKFYIDEEYKNLNDIYNQLIECSNWYSSLNSKLFLNEINNILNNIKLIQENRLKYVNVLDDVIIKYEDASKYTKKIFNYGGNTYE